MKNVHEIPYIRVPLTNSSLTEVREVLLNCARTRNDTTHEHDRIYKFYCISFVNNNNSYLNTL